ncbi:MAG: hypothetical protein JXA93_19645 [Anaerolineae bacterium]|nr:hypothetical protein [Anaerolineae bacterium]
MEAHQRFGILIVDDDKDWRRNLASFLRKQGYLVKTAARSEEANDELETWPFDLVVTNVLLRGEIESSDKKQGVDSDIWRFNWTQIMGDAKDHGTEVVVITSMDKAVGKDEINEVADKYSAKKVFFKTELERNSLLGLVREFSSQQPVVAASQSGPYANCDLAHLAHVLAFHTTLKALASAREQLGRQYPDLIFSPLPSRAPQDARDRLKQTEEQLRLICQVLNDVEPDTVCMLCDMLSDLQPYNEDLIDNLKRLCNCQHTFQGRWPIPPGRAYSYSAIRSLLEDSFTVLELRRFCSERAYLRPMMHSLGADPSLEIVISTLLTYCEQRELMPTLLAEVERERPNQVARYRNTLFL